MLVNFTVFLLWLTLVKVIKAEFTDIKPGHKHIKEWHFHPYFNPNDPDQGNSEICYLIKMKKKILLRLIYLADFSLRI